jgi:hypothetical protein
MNVVLNFFGLPRKKVNTTLESSYRKLVNNSKYNEGIGTEPKRLCPLGCQSIFLDIQFISQVLKTPSSG